MEQSFEVKKHLLNEALQPNTPGILVYEDYWCPISIISATGDTIRITKPAIGDRLYVGAVVQVELCSSQGCLVFNTQVLEIPELAIEGILLAYPRDWNNVCLRKFWRLTVNLPVILKPQAHPQKLRATALNISAGGMLVELPCLPLELADTMDILLTLPDTPNQPPIDMKLMGTITHIAVQEDKMRVSLKFVGMFPDEEEKINKFVIYTLRKSCPTLKV